MFDCYGPNLSQDQKEIAELIDKLLRENYGTSYAPDLDNKEDDKKNWMI